VVTLAAAFLVAVAVASIFWHAHVSLAARGFGRPAPGCGRADSAGSPGGQVAMIINALAASAQVAGAAGVTLLVCYGLCRLVLDRRRLAAWESAWSLTGPRWTTRL